jgi:hypothetical protein
MTFESHEPAEPTEFLLMHAKWILLGLVAAGTLVAGVLWTPMGPAGDQEGTTGADHMLESGR